MTRTTWFGLLLILLVALTLPGCAVVGGIFKAGFWVGVVIAVVIVALVLWIAGKARS